MKADEKQNAQGAAPGQPAAPTQTAQ
jgi:hypothetical protein